VDTEWKAMEVKKEGNTPPFESTPAPIVKPVKDITNQLEAIRSLAINQGLTDESMPKDEQDAKISAFTLLPLKEENLTQIIIKLTSFSK
jgi:hypothetical protein